MSWFITKLWKCVQPMQSIMSPVQFVTSRTAHSGKKVADETCFYKRDASVISDDKCKQILTAELMTRENSLRIFFLTLSTQNTGRPRIASRVFPWMSLKLRFCLDNITSRDWSYRTSLGGKVPHTVVSSCFAPSVGCRGITDRMKQRFTWTERRKIRPGVCCLDSSAVQSS